MEMVTALVDQIVAQHSHWLTMLVTADGTTQILAGLCLILLLLLVVMIARTFAGGNSKQALTEVPPLDLRDEQRAEPVIGTAQEKLAELPSLEAIGAMPTGENPVPDMPAEPVSSIDEDFKIFKRAAPSDPSTVKPSARLQIDEDNELAIIEKNMMRLKELFHEGHITRDVYVDETRTLYHQAKSLIGHG